MCRRYREQGLEKYARNKYQSHRWLLNWEREEEILNQFNDGTGKQVTANEIKTVKAASRPSQRKPCRRYRTAADRRQEPPLSADPRRFSSFPA